MHLPEHSQNKSGSNYSRLRLKCGLPGPGIEKMSFTTPGKAIFVTVSGAPLVNRQISVITYEFYYEPIQHAGCNAVKTSLWNRRVRTCGIDGPGLHFKTPWIDQRFIVDQGEHSLRLPHSEVDRRGTFQNTSKDIDEQEDKLILTGDLYAAV